MRMSRVRELPVIATETVRARLSERFGGAVAAWCDHLPSLVSSIAGEWRLRPGEVVTAGATSVAMLCLAAGGEHVVLKLTPELKMAAEEAAALNAWAGSRHVVTLLDADLDRGALLLERVRPGTRLSEEADWSLEEVAPMLCDLWQPVMPGTGLALPDLRDRVEFVFDLTRRRLYRYPAAAGRVPAGLVEVSHVAARALAGDGPAGLVHGDLHPGNVLRGADGGLVAIDPRPCMGDPAFDSVDWVLAGGSEAAVQQRIHWLARKLATVDPDRVWAWCRALAVVVAVSAFGRGGPGDPQGQALLGLAGEGSR